MSCTECWYSWVVVPAGTRSACFGFCLACRGVPLAVLSPPGERETRAGERRRRLDARQGTAESWNLVHGSSVLFIRNERQRGRETREQRSNADHEVSRGPQVPVGPSGPRVFARNTEAPGPRTYVPRLLRDLGRRYNLLKEFRAPSFLGFLASRLFGSLVSYVAIG